MRSLRDGEKWIERYEDRNTYSPISVGLNDQSNMRGTTSSEKEEMNKFQFPGDWKWGSAHWLIARDMTNEQYKYLLSLPLVLHIPTLHTMVVHAGLLPLDPEKPLTSKQQPLAHVPVLPSSSEHLEERLRNAQEMAVIYEMSVSRPYNLMSISTLLNASVSIPLARRTTTHGLSRICGLY